MGVDVWASLAIGLVGLVLGASWLVNGASKIALMARISPLVVGLTVVAFGTSAPELAISVQAALRGQAGIALGNVVGSNIFNVLFILGASALIAPLVVARQIIRLDALVMIAASALTGLLALNGVISRLEGILLLALGVGYTVWLGRVGRREGAATAASEAAAADAAGVTLTAPPAPTSRDWLVNLAWIVLGLVGLVGGAKLFLFGAESIARWMGVSELVIGLTVVAAGTSLPEVATSLVAVWRGERDIAVGNVVGSNVFNLLIVLGCASIAASGGVEVAPSALSLDLPVMIVVALGCWVVCFTGARVNRWEGSLLLASYVLYLVWLWMMAASHPMLGQAREALLWVVAPAVGAALLVSVARQVGRARRA